jgi:23S rRNA (adenine2030-N6)-methyltransferase
MSYDHRVHAGNAGDVWKHFILAEVAEFLLAKENKLNYAESHVGYPEYLLEQNGEWQEGIGRCWERLDALLDFSYFKIIKSMNTKSSALEKYPGSARIVMEVARDGGSILEAEVWDTDQKVATSWRDMPKLKFGHLRFHLGDGFAGARSILDRNECALLLLDPPYLDRRDAAEAIEILNKAERRRWTVLCWQMMDIEELPEMNRRIKHYPLEFAKIVLSCGKWKGANIILAGDEDLHNYVSKKSEKFLGVMPSPEPI